MNNNPVKYIDPSGHLSCSHANAAEGDCEDRNTRQILSDEYGITLDESERAFSDDEISAIYAAVRSVGVAFTRELIGMTASVAFQQVYGLLTFKRVYRYEYDGKFYDDGACACGGANTIQFASFYQWGPGYTRSESTTALMNRNLVVHELGHMFSYIWLSDSLDNPVNRFSGKLVTEYGWPEYPPGARRMWRQHPSSPPDDPISRGEVFADMFLGWVFGEFANDPVGAQRHQEMNKIMTTSLDDLLP
jgi:hypothetical protein